MQHPVGYEMNDAQQPVLNNVVGVVHQSGVPLVLSARDPGIAGHRVVGDVGRLGVAAPAQRPGGVPPDRLDLARGVGPAVLLNMFIGSELGVVEGK